MRKILENDSIRQKKFLETFLSFLFVNFSKEKEKDPVQQLKGLLNSDWKKNHFLQIDLLDLGQGHLLIKMDSAENLPKVSLTTTL